MIVDTSAIVAVLYDESEGDAFLISMATASSISLSAGSWIELAAVLTRSGNHALHESATRLMDRIGVVIAPVTVEQAEIARDAYRRYGMGTGHPAKLNFGDCFAYALAKSTGEPLLFNGTDFAQTDVARALPA